MDKLYNQELCFNGLKQFYEDSRDFITKPSDSSQIKPILPIT